MIFLLSTTAGFWLRQRADRITLCPLPVIFLLRPDFAVPAYGSFLSEPDYDRFVTSDFRRDFTVPESSAVPDTRPAYRNMPTITDNNGFRLGVCSIGEYSCDIFAASTAPIYEPPLGHGPSLYSSPNHDSMLSTYQYYPTTPSS